MLRACLTKKPRLSKRPLVLEGGDALWRRIRTDYFASADAAAAASMAAELADMSDIDGAEEESAELAAGLEHAAAERAATAALATRRWRRAAVIGSFPKGI